MSNTLLINELTQAVILYVPQNVTKICIENVTKTVKFIKDEFNNRRGIMLDKNYINVVTSIDNYLDDIVIKNTSEKILNIPDVRRINIDTTGDISFQNIEYCDEMILHKRKNTYIPNTLVSLHLYSCSNINISACKFLTKLFVNNSNLSGGNYPTIRELNITNCEEFDVSGFINLKKISISNSTVRNIPHSVKTMEMNFIMDVIPRGKHPIIPPSVKKLTLDCFNYSVIIPPNVEKLCVTGYNKLVAQIIPSTVKILYVFFAKVDCLHSAMHTIYTINGLENNQYIPRTVKKIYTSDTNLSFGNIVEVNSVVTSQKFIKKASFYN